MTFLGSLLILLGGFWLLSNLGLISAELGQIFWPIVLILVGLKMLFSPAKWRKFWGRIEEGKKIKIE